MTTENWTHTPPTVFMMPGQGAQVERMATALYGEDATSTTTVDDVLTGMGPTGWRLRREWLDGKSEVPLADASRAQPLLYAMELGMARSLTARGQAPHAVLGHSIGELVAAPLAGVVDVADAPALLLARGEAMAGSPEGGMLTVHRDADELSAWLAERSELAWVEVGAVNAPMQTILVGPELELGEALRLLRAEGRTLMQAKALQPFHGRVLADCAAQWVETFSPARLRPPTVPLRSTRTGARLTDAEAVNPAFWAGELCGSVLFWPALDGLLTDLLDEDPILVEVEPGAGLSTLARLHPQFADRRLRVVTTSPRPATATAWRDWCTSLDTLAHLGVLDPGAGELTPSSSAPAEGGRS